ncbi:MAG: RHS repeat-associated core domain-containing protein, partial [Planctomycetes bacterium]|nr:RHS repeat-associated core domain-containing protein [Planctomycetota bacterium]
YNDNNKPSSIYYDGETTDFVYSGVWSTHNRAEKGTGSARTIYINSLYEVEDGIATKYILAGGTRVAVKISAGSNMGTYYYHQDHLGSTRVVTNSSGANVGEIHYYPYGEALSDSSPPFIKHKFTSQELDAETGLYHYGDRNYDPVLGRFTTADTIVPDPTNPQALNRYSYVLNNPLKYNDPTGHGWESVQVGWGVDWVPKWSCEYYSCKWIWIPIYYPIYEWVYTPDPEPEPEPKPETNPIPENKSYFHTKSGDTQSGSYLTSATSVLLDVAPVYNSARASYNHFKSGSYVWGGIFVVLAVSDVIPYATGFKVVSKLLRGIFKASKVGGRYIDVRVANKGGEFHHMPADSVSPLSRNEGRGILMDKLDHQKTASWGRSKSAQKYRQQQKNLIDQGKMSDALQMDIADVQSKFGNKYDDHIVEMLNSLD